MFVFVEDLLEGGLLLLGGLVALDVAARVLGVYDSSVGLLRHVIFINY